MVSGDKASLKRLAESDESCSVEVRAGIDHSYRNCDHDEPKQPRLYRGRSLRQGQDACWGLMPVTRVGSVNEVPMALYLEAGGPRPFAAGGHYLCGQGAAAVKPINVTTE